MVLRIIFLGTNGWYSTDMGNTTCILIDTEKYYIILDAGDGIYKLDHYIKNNKPIFIFLSHLHLDHIIGLHILNKFRFGQDLIICGSKGIKKNLEKIICHPFTASFKEISYNISIREIDIGDYHDPFDFTCKFLIHSDPCLGYRFKLEGKIITYCTDTGKCDAIFELAKNADVFISECSYKPGQEEWSWPHLNPSEAAYIAKQSKVKNLILTHFDANMYKTLEERKQANDEARKIFENTTVAYDELEIII